MKKVISGIFIFGILLTGCSVGLKEFSETKILMGTAVEIKVWMFDGAIAKKSISSAFNEIARIENIFSVYNVDSEISKLNRNGSAVVSTETIQLVKVSKYFSEISGGVFDITVLPVIELWKKSKKKGKSPSKAEIENAKKLVGSESILIDTRSHSAPLVLSDDKTGRGDTHSHSAPPVLLRETKQGGLSPARDPAKGGVPTGRGAKAGKTISFAKKGMKIDLGGIAKGYAVDKAVEVLKKSGIKAGMVNAGGDIKCFGKKVWRIALQNPRDKNDFITVLKIQNKAVTTSGDYERYFLLDKTKISHIINPLTGYSADESISATIIADTAVNADALATATFVLGAEKGVELIEKFKNAECLIIDKNRKIHKSTGFSKYE